MSKILFFSALAAVLWAQSPAQIVNSNQAKWQHDADDPPGGESLVLRMDKANGNMEFMARYPAGFKIKPHAHKANERFLLFEGRASIEAGGAPVMLDPGGYAFFSAGQTHNISCISTTRCMFFVQWDAKP